ncbi:MAG: putative metal-binding motif-containing protein [Deltaproteobacteria bacterium]|nr:putative metal-binding motif-containing protein [Deltaproteobacteria bacterium]
MSVRTPVALILLAALAGCAASKGDRTESATLDGGLDPAKEPTADAAPVGDADPGPGFGTDSALPSPDPEKDNDGDGWAFKDDCNDKDPMVNPGAYDVLGDGVDNDCNGTVDDPSVGCDTTGIKLDTKNALDFARALGICQVADPSGEGKDKRWGLMSAQLVRADGTPVGDPMQHGIMRKFGTNVSAKSGANLVVLSSGTARTPDQPGFITAISPSFRTASEVAPPPGWPKPTSGCPTPSKTTANDSVGLKLTMRVPTNAKSFSFDFDFYSSEYINFVCSSYNDSFVALLKTGAKLDPASSGNVSFDAMKNPINVNSGFFEVCTPGSRSGKTFACAKGTKELEGTGFWDPSRAEQNGATSWLRTKAPVMPGETMTIQFLIWDTGDHILDSTVLIDNWQWDATPSTNPSTDRPPA